MAKLKLAWAVWFVVSVTYGIEHNGRPLPLLVSTQTPKLYPFIDKPLYLRIAVFCGNFTPNCGGQHSLEVVMMDCYAVKFVERKPWEMALSH